MDPGLLPETARRQYHVLRQVRNTFTAGCNHRLPTLVDVDSFARPDRMYEIFPPRSTGRNDISTTKDLAGHATFAGHLALAGHATFAGHLALAGHATFAGHLALAGHVTFAGHLALA